MYIVQLTLRGVTIKLSHELFQAALILKCFLFFFKIRKYDTLLYLYHN